MNKEQRDQKEELIEENIDRRRPPSLYEGMRECDSEGGEGGNNIKHLEFCLRGRTIRTI